VSAHFINTALHCTKIRGASSARDSWKTSAWVTSY